MNRSKTPKSSEAPSGNQFDIVIPVMGPTGVGKSTFINAVLGQENMAVGYEFESCTVDIATAEVDVSELRDFPCLKNRRLLLVDTPGFDDTYVNDSEILERISKWLENSYRAHQVLGGVIYLHDISIDRIMGSTRKNLDMFNKLCGEAAFHKVVLGTTKSGRILTSEAEKRVARLKEVHWKDMADKGARVFQFDGSHSSALDLVNTVLERFDEMEVLEIQRELVDRRKPPRKPTSGFTDTRGPGSKSDLSSSLPDIVIPVMGPTGVGKSTFINAVLGNNRMAVGQGIDSCTSEIAIAEVDTSTLLHEFPWLKNHRLLLVDTPGFDDTYVADSEILERIAKWLENSYRTQLALGGVIYLHDISKNRFTGSARKNLAMFKRLCGQGALDKVVLGTTMGSRIPLEADKRLAGLKESHWKDIIDNGAQVFEFHGDHPSASALLNIVLQRYGEKEKEKTVLAIQRELVDKKKTIPETGAGKELRITLQRVVEQHKRGAGGDADADADAHTLEKEQIDQIYKQLHSLEVSLLRRLLAILGFH